MTLTSADFPTWTQVTVAGSKPPARYRAAMVYDVLSGTALLFGGYDGTTTFDDFWKWDGATRTWTKLPSGPPARRSPAMGFDPIAKKLFLFSGRAANGTFLPDAWQWDGTAWNQLTTGTPSPRNDARMAWDAARGRLVLAGGSTSAGDLTGDVWELDGAHGTWEYQPVSPVPRDGLEMLSSIDDRAGVLLLGGFDLNGDAIDDFSRIGRDGDAQYETCRGIDVDADNHIDCDDADCWAFCTPQCTPGMDCTGLPRTCGDGVAVPELEQCTTCPEDAGACATLCGNLVCDPDEEMASCPGDCFN
jgi:hypothetical protein